VLVTGSGVQIGAMLDSTVGLSTLERVVEGIGSKRSLQNLALCMFPQSLNFRCGQGHVRKRSKQGSRGNMA